MAVLADPRRSQAVLIGVSRYETLEDLPAVENNLMGFREILTDTTIWGLPPANCHVMDQPEDPTVVMDTLESAAAKAEDTLLVYFAGHGLIDPTNDEELCLALPGSTKDRAYRRSIPYAWIRKELQEARVRRKVVILDCCYSGRAIGRWMGDGEDKVTDRLEINGTCLLTATARTHRALSPLDERFTAFTGELLSILGDGVPSGPELLDMDTVYRQLAIRLRAKSLPSPQRGQLDDGGNIALARNRNSGAFGISSHEPRFPGSDTDSNSSQFRPSELPWSQSIDHRREPTVNVGQRPINEARSSFILIMTLWTLSAASLALAQKPQLWLAMASGVTLLAIFCARVSHRRIRAAGWSLVLAGIALYILTAVTFAHGWGTRAWIIVQIIFTAIVLSIVFGGEQERPEYDEAMLTYERRQVLGKIFMRERWIDGGDSDDGGSAILEPLSAIPAARFASLSEGCFAFLVVAGSRMVLVAFSYWPPGIYTSRPGVRHDVRRDGKVFPLATEEISAIHAQMVKWQSIFQEATILAVLVIRSSSHSAGQVTVRMLEEDGLSFTSLETFEDTAGPFLINGGYELDMRILERLITRLQQSSVVV